MSRKVTAPTARSTAYDFNAQLAKCHLRHAASISNCMVEHAAYPESRDVMPHEILFATAKDVKSADARLRCMSSLNGVCLNQQTISSVQAALKSCGCTAETLQLFSNETTAAQRKPLLTWLDQRSQTELDMLNDVLTQNFVYIGIAITPCKAGDTSALQRQGFSATRGGLMTVMNTGHKIIAPGQKVRMVIDLRDLVSNSRKFNEKLDGVPQQKILARLQPVDETLHNTFAQVLQNVNKSQIKVNLHEPIILTPKMQYVAAALQNSQLKPASSAGSTSGGGSTSTAGSTSGGGSTSTAGASTSGGGGGNPNSATTGLQGDDEPDDEGIKVTEVDT